MRKILVVAAFLLGALSGQAQEKVMNIQKKDGTKTQARVADLEKISFLTVEEGGQGLLVRTSGGETAAVLFETHPVVTIADGKLTIAYGSTDTVEFEIADVKEILLGDASDPESVRLPEGFSFVVQDNGMLLRGIPNGVRARVYSLDGRSLPSPTVIKGKLLLSRATLGTGIFIVRVGTFCTKVHF